MKVQRLPATDCWHRWKCTDTIDVGRVLLKGGDQWLLTIGERGSGTGTLYLDAEETRKLFGDTLADFVLRGRPA